MQRKLKQDGVSIRMNYEGILPPYLDGIKQVRKTKEIFRYAIILKIF